MTAPHYQDERVTIHHGDCLHVLRDLPPNSVHAIITDPPYGLEFMGKEWDSFGSRQDVRQRDDTTFTTGDRRHGLVRHGIGASYGKDTAKVMRAFQQWCEQWAAECLRVLKPGGHMLAFGGTRTWHRLTCAIEDAGFEIRDSIAWLYGSGFPKSLDVSKVIDKAAGAEREVTSVQRSPFRMADPYMGDAYMSTQTGDTRKVDADGYIIRETTAPVTDDARAWEGWGTALKPSHEPIVVARKPLAGTVAQNVLAHGTGALNINACRVGMSDTDRDRINSMGGFGQKGWTTENGTSLEGRVDGSLAHVGAQAHDQGRWPPNVALDNTQAAELDKQSGVTRDGVAVNRNRTERKESDVPIAPSRVAGPDVTYGGEGGASRFFPIFRYQAKAPTHERPTYPQEGAGEGRVIEGTTKVCRVCGCKTIKSPRPEPSCGHNDYERVPTAPRTDRVAHPTVKPLDLMRWLCRLVTPPDGVILDPFAGSGTTIEAALLEGFRSIGIENCADYLPLIRTRIDRATQAPLFPLEGM